MRRLNTVRGRSFTIRRLQYRIVVVVNAAVAVAVVVAVAFVVDVDHIAFRTE